MCKFIESKQTICLNSSVTYLDFSMTSKDLIPTLSFSSLPRSKSRFLIRQIFVQLTASVYVATDSKTVTNIQLGLNAWDYIATWPLPAVSSQYLKMQLYIHQPSVLCISPLDSGAMLINTKRLKFVHCYFTGHSLIWILIVLWSWVSFSRTVYLWHT